ncbi:MAG: peptidoglycan DD-metalloendopeptidase family protein [Actinobacteria bacterium]|nr:peptidoglycan DD-metalloendopeptidase family protein [Actinomycetota bacterium]
MRKKLQVVCVILGVVVILLAATMVQAGQGTAPSLGEIQSLYEVGREFANRPLEAPAYLTLRVPAGAEKADLVYERLSFGEVYRVPAFISGDFARAVVPARHTSQPGISYHWEVIHAGRTLITPDTHIPFLDLGILGSTPGQWIAHDIEINGGRLPSGYVVSSGQGALPHSLSASQAPITSKLLEVRTVTTSEIHMGIDYGMTEGNVVKAMQGGVVWATGYDSQGFGNYVFLSHEGGQYYSHYGHLKTISVSQGQSVSKGQQVGLSGNTGASTGPHLDAGYDTWVSGDRIVLYPFRYFMASYSPYSGTDFDYIQKPINGFHNTYGSYTDVNVYPKGTSAGSPQVYMVYRQQGTSTWSNPSGMPLYSGTTYRHWWDPSLDGKTMEYYIRVEAVPPGTLHWASRPAKYHGATPDAPYYTILVKKGIGAAPPVQEGPPV